MLNQHYYQRLAAAYVRGKLTDLPAPLARPPLDQLGEPGWAALIQLGLQQNLRLHRFKKTMELPRVRKILGALQGIGPHELLDVGTGRGAFLWPLLDRFPNLAVTAIDRLEHRVSDLLAVRRGGLDNLQAREADLTALPFPAGRFPCITALEVLEHLQDARAGLAELSRVGGRFLLLTVPAKPDHNPEHLHHLHGQQLAAWLRELGWSQVKLDGVLNHQVVIASR